MSELNNGLLAPECWSEQYQQSEDLESTEQHGEAQNPFTRIVHLSIVQTDIT